MFEIKDNCFKCKEEVCIRCGGIKHKKDQVLALISHRQRTIELGKLEKLAIEEVLAKVKHYDFKLSRIRSNA